MGDVEETRSLEACLEEMINLQNELQIRMRESNEKLENGEFEKFREFITQVASYTPKLKQISKDVVEVCERTENLKKRIKQLGLELKICEETTKSNSSGGGSVSK